MLFRSELHSIKVTDDYAALIKGDQTWRLDVVNRISRCKEFITRYEEYFVQAGFQKSLLLTVLDLFNHLNFTTARKSYLHGDLYSRHVIVHPETLSLSGLIDWGDVHLGHPGIDLAIGMIFTEETFKVFLDAYDDIDEETIHILLFHSFCHSISFLPYAYEQDKESLKLWGSLALVRAISEIKKLVKM